MWGRESRSRRTFSIAITPAISALKSDQYLQGERRRGVSCCNRTGGGHAQAHAEFGAREVAACRRAGRDGGSLPALDAQHPQPSQRWALVNRFTDAIWASARFCLGFCLLFFLVEMRFTSG